MNDTGYHSDTQYEEREIPFSHSGMRLDQSLSRIFSSLSRTQWQHLIEKKCVYLNDTLPKKRDRVAGGEKVRIRFPQQESYHLTPEPMSFHILYEDEQLFIINKPPNLVVHPAPGNRTGTFVHGFLAHCQTMQGLDPIRPGIVHRLDKETSGVLIAAKTLQALDNLSQQFQKRSVIKEYLAIVSGTFPKYKQIQHPIGRDPKNRKKMTVLPTGRSAYTECFSIKHISQYSLLKILLHTGRTHQIRVHLRYEGFPVTGDTLYGYKHRDLHVTRQLLHCHKITFFHPLHKEPLAIEAPLPHDMEHFLKIIGRNS